jgi:adenylate kinase family enzyme
MPQEQEYYFMNVESKHVYKLDRNDDEYVYIIRYFKYTPENEKYAQGDEFPVKLSFSQFRRGYVPVPPAELDRIRTQITQGVPEQEYDNLLLETTERDDFTKLILDPKIVDTIMTGIKKIEKRQELDEVWGLGDIRPLQGKVAMNFYGPPGTGKTMAARALARKLNKKIMQVDYANMISKWVGDTAKHIKGAFADAKKADAMLFFDEADSMLSKRVEHTGEPHENSVNQNRNVLMQELDRFDNVVIFATNFFKNYDEALLRRIAQHIEFVLPDEERRLKILEMKVPQKARDNGKVAEDVCLPILAKMAENFSGSDLENIVANSIEHCAAHEAKLDQSTLIGELEKIKKSKDKHSGKLKKGPLGFGDLV